MNAMVITEVVANEGRTCAFKAPDQTLGVAREDNSGRWMLRLQTGTDLPCEDFDEMRLRILDSLAGRGACFERRRIQPRRHLHQPRTN